MSQKISVNKTGRYRFSLSFMGDNTTGVKVQMYILANGSKLSHAIFPEEIWHEHSIDIEITELSGADTEMELEVGLQMDSPVSYGAVKDMKFKPV